MWRHGLVVGCCEFGNEISGSIKSGVISRLAEELSASGKKKKSAA